MTIVIFWKDIDSKLFAIFQQICSLIRSRSEINTPSHVSFSSLTVTVTSDLLPCHWPSVNLWLAGAGSVPGPLHHWAM